MGGGGGGAKILFAASGSHDQDGRNSHIHVMVKIFKYLLRNKLTDLCSIGDSGHSCLFRLIIHLIDIYLFYGKVKFFYRKKRKVDFFSEIIAVFYLIVGRCRQLIE